MSEIASSPKGYGLILKKPQKASTALSKPSIFASDSDSDGGSSNQARFNIKSLQEKYASKASKQIKQFIEDSPDMYQYDEVYDAMEDSRMRRRRNVQAKEKKSKYVSLIKDMSHERESERDRRLERKYISERENEGELYKDKESYTTPGYKKYLEERVADDEKEKAREEEETRLDVRKQKDLSLFYSHLLTDNVAMGGSITTNTSSVGTAAENVVLGDQANSLPKNNERIVESNVDTQIQNTETQENMKEEREISEEITVEEKKDVFAKRTTEEVRLAALERYLVRKRKRISALTN